MRNVGTWLGLLVLMAASDARADMHSALSDACSTNSCTVLGITRELVPGTTDVAHYFALVKVGSGAHDTIGIHRVVRENAPWQPKSLSDAILLVHGDVLDFISSYMVGPSAGSAASSYAVFMAQSNIDVWGIDQRSRVVPAGTIDPGDPASDDFMAGWTLRTQSRDTRLAMLIARVGRVLTGSPFNKIVALGWSRGGQTLYVAAQEEAVVSSALRSMKAMTIVDVPLKSDPADTALIASACSFANNIDAQLAAGIYVDATGSVLHAAGDLAATSPGDPSPFLPGLTNGQVPLFFAGATFNLIPYIPTYHLCGSNFAGGFPTDFRYTEYNAFVATMRAIPSYEAIRIQGDGDRVVCADTEYDDDLSKVKIPVYYLNAVGGIGPEGLYTLTLLGSTDVTIDTLHDPGVPRLNDIGHDDMFRSRVGGWWERNRDWVKSH